MKKTIITIFSSLFLLPLSAQIDLSGSWAVSLQGDPDSYEISLPGTTDLAGIGTPDTLSPLLRKPQLLHLTRKHSFVGEAIYSRSIQITEEMAGKPLRLSLDRVMWRSKPMIDGQPLFSADGSPEYRESLTTPHTYLIPDGLSEGTHTLSLSIDNSKLYEISSGNLAHAYTNDTQVMWNGVLGEMRLDVVPEIDITDLQIYPDVDAGAVKVKMAIDSRLKKPRNINLSWTLSDLPGNNGKQSSSASTLHEDRAVNLSGSKKLRLPPGSDTISFTLSDPILKEALWSEFDPRLLQFSVTAPASTASKAPSSRSAIFGMRKIERNGDRLLINGSPIFLRGTLECCIFPLTGNPPTTEEGWEHVFDTAREWGLNHLRFHSWCPPEAAFRVADRKGFYLQVELPLWSTEILPGNDGANGEMKRFIRDEYDSIISAYGNHPSFCLMTVGNELQKDFDWLNEMTAHMHASDPRHLYAATSFTFEKGHGGHAEPNDDFIVTQWTDQGWVRGQGVFNSEPPAFNKNYASSTSALTVPLIEHEIGQYAVYPDLKEIPEYIGTLTPHNFIAVKLDLERKGRLDRAEEYLQASGALAALLYKEEIERAMKTPGVSGFQLLGLQDFTGQGTALVGLVNAFWESKGIVEPDWFRRFCSPVVTLADFEKAAYLTTEPFTADIIVANYDPSLTSAETVWQLTDSKGKTIGEGTLPAARLNPGVNRIGSISASLSGITKPEKLMFTVSLPTREASNSWSIWAYPELPAAADFGSVIPTRSIDEALALLKEGKNVLLSPERSEINATQAKFVPVFWSPVHFPHEAGAMGITCHADHPALEQFPNDGHTDWQWWHTLTNSSFVDMDLLPGASPIIEMVDNFTTNRSLAILMEAKIGEGRLMITTADLLAPELHATQRQLLESIINYMNSSAFNPSASLEESALKDLVKTPETR